MAKLEFPEAFFEGEEREGFYIESMMKRAWAIELEVLSEVDRICEKYGLRYFADSGTLLGAVRHKGYIPWDDDIDIVMLREDYNRFIQVVRAELPEGFVANSPLFENKYMPHMCIFNSNVYSTAPKHLERFYGCPYPVGIDVFPLDTIPADPEDEQFMKMMIGTLLRLIKKDIGEEAVRAALAQVEELCGVHIDRNGDIKKQLSRLAEAMVQLYGEADGELVTIWGFYALDNYPSLPRKIFDEMLELPFEQRTVPAVRDYHYMLEAIYGADYMTPKQGTAMHNYPFYGEVREAVERRAKEEGWENFQSL